MLQGGGAGRRVNSLFASALILCGVAATISSTWMLIHEMVLRRGISESLCSFHVGELLRILQYMAGASDGPAGSPCQQEYVVQARAEAGKRRGRMWHCLDTGLLSNALRGG